MKPSEPQDAWSLEPKTVARMGRVADCLSAVVCITFAIYVTVQVITAVLVAIQKF